MNNLYKSILMVCAVFALAMMMYCLRHGTSVISLKQMLLPALIFGVGLALGALAKPALE
ncbi:hypothetical protein [Pontibacter mangrovi]|uniref:hypothetical protein n=1 Tax=Pontibacter mangrovi TaxID=2589816 RepID=UPI0015E49660|nr:hypothetical protein [Pontibacter mangrovi]